MSESKKPRKVVDWEAVEKHYRAGIKTLRQIGEEYGVSHVAIQKRAEKLGWARDLTAKVQQKAQEVVTRQEVTSTVTTEKLLTDAQTVQAYGEIVANVDMSQRSDVRSSMDAARSMLGELSALCDPQFRERLEWLGEVMDESGLDDNGKMVKDRVNELYRYVISLPGRIKMIKEMAAAHGVYIPLQRKIYKLDGDEDKSQSAVDELLRKINAEG